MSVAARMARAERGRSVTIDISAGFPEGTEARAKRLYEVYLAAPLIDGKNYQGLPCPAWEAPPEPQKQGWMLVALESL